MEFQGDYDAYKKREQLLEANLTKAYALLWEHCSKSMQHRIEALSDYQSRIENDPIALLQTIKQQAISFQEDRYDVAIITEALRTLILTKQKEHENLQDYTKRFKTARDIVESHFGGPIQVPKLVKATPGYDPNDPGKTALLIKDTFERWMTYMYLENSDQLKYKSLLMGLNQQISLGNNQFPTTVVAANQVLSNHRLDNAVRNKERSRGIIKREDNEEPEELPQLSFAQLEGKCYCCGKGGHKSPQCKYKAKPKEEWSINKVKAAEQSYANTTPNDQQAPPRNAQTATTTQPSVISSVTGWAGVHLQLSLIHI